MNKDCSMILYLMKCPTFFMLLVFANTGFTQGLPIKSARTIKIKTDEGSYMSVDLSHDGKKLVFDLLGDLFIVSIEGGKAKQITRGVALNMKPVWSPDDKRIAFFSDLSGAFQFNTLDVSKKAVRRQIICPVIWPYQAAPIWDVTGNGLLAPDGMLYKIEASKTDTNTNIKNTIRYSLDGKFIFSLDSGKIFKYNLEQKTRIAITSELASFYSSTLSPDGQWWCYTTDSSSHKMLVAQNLISNEKKTLVADLEHRFNQHFSFDFDSKNIFIGYGGKIHRINISSGANSVVPFTVDVKSDLGPFDYNTFRITHDSLKIKYARSANLSPDRKYVVFSALEKVYRMSITTRKPYLIAEQEVSQFQPAYSPDGIWVAYVSWSDTVGGYLWKTKADGTGKPKQLTLTSGQYQRPSWSPDGQWIAVAKGEPKLGTRDDPGMGLLEIVNSNDGDEIKIIDTVPLWNNIQFSADGSRIIYTPTRRFDIKPYPPYPFKLVSKKVNGSDLQEIAMSRDGFFYMRQKAISPDGKYLVYSDEEDLYLVELSQSKQPVILSRNNSSAIRFAPGVDPYWDSSGRFIMWTYGNRFYRTDINAILHAATKSNVDQDFSRTTDKSFTTAIAKPEQVIDLGFNVSPFYGRGTIVLANARIITMNGDRVFERGTIIIKNGKIHSISNSISAPITSNSKVIDLSGKTIMPGLIDLHLHTRVPPNIFPQQSWVLMANFAYGVTTARDPALSFDSFGYAELIQTGQMRGPRLFSVGKAVNDEVMVGTLTGDGADAIVAKRKLVGAIVVKNYLSYIKRLPRQLLVTSARNAGLNITNEGYSEPLLQIGMIKDGSTGVEHSPNWGDVQSDVIEFYARAGTFYTPTLIISNWADGKEGKEYFKYKYWHEPNNKLERFLLSNPLGKSCVNCNESYETILNSKYSDTPYFVPIAKVYTRILQAGGRVAVGSHGEDAGIGVHNEIWALQMGGFTNMQALRAATITGAQALGIQNDIGSIKVGKIADLLILDKNPLEDIHNTRTIRYVMKDGILYDGDTLDEIWPEKQKCPEWKFKK